MKLGDLENVNINFTKAFRYSLAGSGILMIFAILQIAIFGMNFGIDFRGGTILEIRMRSDFNLATIRSDLNRLNLGDIQVQQFGEKNNLLLRIEQQVGGDEVQQKALSQVKTALSNNLGASNIEYRRIEVIGPTISSELLKNGLIATFLSISAMLFYIWLRFEWQFSLGAVSALIHDVLLTAGVFSFMRFEFNLSTIAAGLAIIGYSMNDTVVIFDRIRDTIDVKQGKNIGFLKLIDISIRSTLNRTWITSFTTLLALGSLLILGGPAIFGFAFAMSLGTIFGTYSSIFIASPLLYYCGGTIKGVAVREDKDDVYYRGDSKDLF